MPGLIWNTMMSMSGGWFFVVASEAITVGDTTITLPGIGSYIALAIDAGNWCGDRRAVLTMVDRHPRFTISCCSGRSSPGRRSSGSNSPQARTVETSWVLNLLQRTRWLRSGIWPIAPRSRP